VKVGLGFVRVGLGHGLMLLSLASSTSLVHDRTTYLGIFKAQAPLV